MSERERKSGRLFIAIVSLFVELIENTRKYIFSLTHNKSMDVIDMSSSAVL